MEKIGVKGALYSGKFYLQAFLESIGLPINCIRIATFKNPEFALREICISFHVAPQRLPIDVNIHSTEVIKHSTLPPYTPDFRIVLR